MIKYLVLAANLLAFTYSMTYYAEYKNDCLGCVSQNYYYFYDSDQSCGSTTGWVYSSYGKGSECPVTYCQVSSGSTLTISGGSGANGWSGGGVSKVTVAKNGGTIYFANGGKPAAAT